VVDVVDVGVVVVSAGGTGAGSGPRSGSTGAGAVEVSEGAAVWAPAPSTLPPNPIAIAPTMQSVAAVRARLVRRSAAIAVSFHRRRPAGVASS
jgi:hypothetical protein